MGLIKFSNFAASTIANAGGITAGDTSVDVDSGDGALFPSLAGSQYFYATLVDASANREIVKVTARATDTLTIVRAQDGTSARAFAQGDVIELRITAAAMNMITDLNGEELILDADGDTSITADTDDKIDVKVAGADQVSFQDGKIEPSVDNDIDLGSATKEYKNVYIDGVAYIDEFDMDGSHKAAFPTNGVGADAKIMTGDSNTILWMYLNTAPPGWKVVSGVSDVNLAVAGGADAYNVDGGNVAGESYANLKAHTHSTPAHTHPAHKHKIIEMHTNLADEVYDSGGSQVDVSSRPPPNAKHFVILDDNINFKAVNADIYSQPVASTSGGSGTSGAQSTADVRPAAALGTMQYMDI